MTGTKNLIPKSFKPKKVLLKQFAKKHFKTDKETCTGRIRDPSDGSSKKQKTQKILAIRDADERGSNSNKMTLNNNCTAHTNFQTLTGELHLDLENEVPLVKIYRKRKLIDSTDKTVNAWYEHNSPEKR